MHHIRKLMGVAVAVGVVACETPPAAPTYTVTATFDNAPDVPMTSRLTLAYSGRAATGTRVVSDEALGFTFLRTIALAVSRGGTTVPSPDSYVLQVGSRPAVSVDQEPDASVTRTGDWAWMEAHGWDMIVVGLQATTLAAPTTLALPPLSPQRTSAAAWLAAIEDDDVEIPYFVAPGTPACRVLTGTDCFDVQTMAMTLLDGVVAGIRAAADPSTVPGANPRDPEPLVRATGITSSIAYIPNVVHPGLDRDGRRARGVGFVLKLTFEARAAGGDGQVGPAPIDVGTPYHRVTVWVPIALHFEDDGEGGIQVTIDPIDLATGVIGPEMAAHAAVEVENPPGGQIAGIAIADTALKIVTDRLNATGPLANIGSGVFAAMINTMRPVRRLPANFDVVLVPPTGVGTAAPNDLSRSAGATGPALVFLE